MDLRDELQASLGTTYILERELGGGGMSRLFLADDVTLRRKVVVKLLPPTLASEVGVERFQREVMVIARLQHPHIVSVIGTGSAGDASWYVMPFVHGESLRQRLERDGALPVDEALGLLREIADALAYAHSAGVVHRDIKPANVLLSQGHAVLADFGIAHARGSVASDTTDLTETGIGLGTPRYMAPEQFMSAARVDARADVYALGVVAYEMLTGRAPFEGRSGPELLVAHVRETPIAPRKIRADIPARVSTAIMRALAKEPDDRWQSASEFKHAINVGGSSRARAWQWGRNQRIAAIVAAGVASIAAVAGLPSRRTAPRSDTDPNLIAVAPFTVLAPQMAMWRDGMVDVLSRSLDGWGPLRSVAPSTVPTLPFERADTRSADAFARAAKAGVVVFGTLYQSGPDSVRAAVTVYDAGSRRVMGELERRAEATRMEVLSDSLTAAILEVIGGARSIVVLPRAQTVGTISISAIKEFLKGQRLLRLAQFDSARPHFEKAIQLDSGFALAYHGLGQSLGWVGQSASNAMRLRAGALNHGLGPRDSLTLTADSIWGALETGDAAPARRLPDRLFGTLEKLTREYSDNAEGWFMLGDARVHYGVAANEPPTPLDVLAAFDNAIRIDQSFVAAYLHTTEYALLANDVPRARSYAQRMLERGVGGRYADGARLFLQLTDHPYDNAAIERLVRSLDERDDWIMAWGSVAKEAYLDSAATIARLFIAMATTPGSGQSIPVVRLKQEASREFAKHGQIRASRAASRAVYDPRSVGLARLGLIDADSLSHAEAQRYLRNDSLGTYLGFLPFWAEHGDSLAINRFLTRDGRRNVTNPIAASYRRARAAYASASLALARRDTVHVLMWLDSIPEGSPELAERAAELRGRVLLTSSPKRAARLLAAHANGEPSVEDVPGMERLLAAARAAERGGDRDVARMYYTRLATAWAHADPELGRYVEEINRSLARLGSPAR